MATVAIAKAGTALAVPTPYGSSVTVASHPGTPANSTNRTGRTDIQPVVVGVHVLAVTYKGPVCDAPPDIILAT